MEIESKPTHPRVLGVLGFRGFLGLGLKNPLNPCSPSFGLICGTALQHRALGFARTPAHGGAEGDPSLQKSSAEPLQLDAEDVLSSPVTP